MNRRISLEMRGGRRGEHGQALVILAGAIIALLAAVGLAIDGGMVLLERRRMQNAADAASRAGTRELVAHFCDTSEVDLDDLVEAQVQSYSEGNGVEDPASNVFADYVVYDDAADQLVVAGRVGDGDIPTGTAGISATVRIQRPTAFLRLVGLQTGAASAHATAVAAPLKAITSTKNLPGGVLPIGFHEDGLPETFEQDLCIIDDQSWRNEDEDGVIADPVNPIAMANRGWLMLTCIFNDGRTPGDPVASRYPDCAMTNNSLKGWIDQTDPFTDPIWAGTSGDEFVAITEPLPYWSDVGFCPDGDAGTCEGGWGDGDWIHGAPGKRAVDFARLEQLGIDYPDELFWVPVFDTIFTKYKDKGTTVNKMQQVAENSTGEYPYASTIWNEPDNLFTTYDFYYHIVGFIGVTFPAKEPSGECSKGFYVDFEPIVIPQGTGSAPEDPEISCEQRMYTLMLVE